MTTTISIEQSKSPGSILVKKTTLKTETENVYLDGVIIEFKPEWANHTQQAVLVRSGTSNYILLAINRGELSCNRYTDDKHTVKSAEENLIDGTWKYVGKAKISVRAEP